MNKLSKVKVTALHGFKENTVAVDFLPNKPMSFVYGFNGIGKTTVFKLMNAALNEDFDLLKKYKFETIDIKFDDSDDLQILITNNVIKYIYNNSDVVLFDLEKKTPVIFDEKFNKSLKCIKIDLLLCDDFYTTQLSDLDFANKDPKLNEVFEDVIENPGLTDKYIEINDGKLEAFLTYDEEKTNILNFLSHGEKNLLLLYYHLVYKIQENLIDDEIYIQLIDTPETCLNVNTQITFYANLLYINEKLNRKNIQYVIESHSAALTYNHNELMRAMRRYNDEN